MSRSDSSTARGYRFAVRAVACKVIGVHIAARIVHRVRYLDRLSPDHAAPDPVLA
jgi:hypothetical protein